MHRFHASTTGLYTTARRSFTIGAFLCLLFAAQYAVARYPENGLGGITGKLTGDLKGVPKAIVFLMQHDEIVDKTETDADGFYKFKFVAEGKYDLKATKDGYRTCIVLKIPVIPDHVTKLDFYFPRFNNDHMPDDPIVETYDYYYKHMDHPGVSYPR